MTLLVFSYSQVSPLRGSSENTVEHLSRLRSRINLTLCTLSRRNICRTKGETHSATCIAGLAGCIRLSLTRTFVHFSDSMFFALDQQSLCREASMGPVRSLYEREGELERVLTRGPVMLRPMQILDCGKRKYFAAAFKAYMTL